MRRKMIGPAGSLFIVLFDLFLYSDLKFRMAFAAGPDNVSHRLLCAASKIVGRLVLAFYPQGNFQLYRFPHVGILPSKLGPMTILFDLDFHNRMNLPESSAWFPYCRDSSFGL